MNNTPILSDNGHINELVNNPKLNEFGILPLGAPSDNLYYQAQLGQRREAEAFLIYEPIFSNISEVVSEVNGWLNEARQKPALAPVAPDSGHAPAAPAALPPEYHHGHDTEGEKQAMRAMLLAIAHRVRRKGGKREDVKQELLKWRDIINAVAPTSPTPWQDVLHLATVLNIKPEFFAEWQKHASTDRQSENFPTYEDRWRALVDDLAKDHKEHLEHSRYSDDLTLLNKIGNPPAIGEYLENWSINYRVGSNRVGIIQHLVRSRLIGLTDEAGIASVYNKVATTNTTLNAELATHQKTEAKAQRKALRDTNLRSAQYADWRSLDLSIDEIYHLRQAGVLEVIQQIPVAEKRFVGATSVMDQNQQNEFIALIRERAITKGVSFKQEMTDTLQKVRELKEQRKKEEDKAIADLTRDITALREPPGEVRNAAEQQLETKYDNEAAASYATYMAEILRRTDTRVHEISQMQEASSAAQAALDFAKRDRNLWQRKEVAEALQQDIARVDNQASALLKQKLDLKALNLDFAENIPSTDTPKTQLEKLLEFGLTSGEIATIAGQLNIKFKTAYVYERTEYEYIKIAGRYSLTKEMLQCLQRATTSFRSNTAQGLEKEETDEQKRASKMDLLSAIRLAESLTRKHGIKKHRGLPSIDLSVCQQINIMAASGFNKAMTERLILAQWSHDRAAPVPAPVLSADMTSAITMFARIFKLEHDNAKKLVLNLHAQMREKKGTVSDNALYQEVQKLCEANCDKDAQKVRLYWNKYLDDKPYVDLLCQSEIFSYKELCALELRRADLPKWLDDILSRAYQGAGYEQRVKNILNMLKQDVENARLRAFEIQQYMLDIDTADVLYSRLVVDQVIPIPAPPGIANPDDPRARLPKDRAKVALMAMGLPAALAQAILDKQILVPPALVPVPAPAPVAGEAAVAAAPVAPGAAAIPAAVPVPANPAAAPAPVIQGAATPAAVPVLRDQTDDEHTQTYTHVKKIRKLHPSGGIIATKELELLDQVARFRVIIPDGTDREAAVMAEKAALVAAWLPFGAGTTDWPLFGTTPDWTHAQGFKFTEFCRLQAKAKVVKIFDDLPTIYSTPAIPNEKIKGENGLKESDLAGLTDLMLKYNLSEEQVKNILATDHLNLDVCKVLLEKAQNSAKAWAADTGINNNRSEQEWFSEIIKHTFANKETVGRISVLARDHQHCPVSKIYEIVLQAYINDFRQETNKRESGHFTTTIDGLTGNVESYFSYEPKWLPSTGETNKTNLQKAAKGSYTPDALLLRLRTTWTTRDGKKLWPTLDEISKMVTENVFEIEPPVGQIQAENPQSADDKTVRGKYRNYLDQQAQNLNILDIQGHKANLETAGSNLLDFNLRRGYISQQQIVTTLLHIGRQQVILSGALPPTAVALHNFAHWRNHPIKDLIDPTKIYCGDAARGDPTYFKDHIYPALVVYAERMPAGIDGIWTVRDFERFKDFPGFSLQLFDSYVQKHYKTLHERLRAENRIPADSVAVDTIEGAYSFLCDHYKDPANRSKGVALAKQEIVNQVATQLEKDFRFHTWFSRLGDKIKWELRAAVTSTPKIITGLPIAVYHLATTGLGGSISIWGRGDSELESGRQENKHSYHWKSAGQLAGERVTSAGVAFARVALIVGTPVALGFVLRMVFYNLAHELMEVPWPLIGATIMKNLQDTMMAHAWRLLLYQNNAVATVGQLQDTASVTISSTNAMGSGVSIAGILANIASVASIGFTVASLYVLISRYTRYKEQQQVKGEEVEGMTSAQFAVFTVFSFLPLALHFVEISSLMQTFSLSADMAIITNAVLLFGGSAIAFGLSYHFSKQWYDHDVDTKVLQSVFDVLPNTLKDKITPPPPTPAHEPEQAEGLPVYGPHLPEGFVHAGQPDGEGDEPPPLGVPPIPPADPSRPPNAGDGPPPRVQQPGHTTIYTPEAYINVDPAATNAVATVSRKTRDALL